MNRPISPGEVQTSPPLWAVLPLLWLAGNAIRIPMIAIPPVIPLIHDDLHMSETQVGILMGLPLGMFALAAVPGSLLIARFGVVAVATTGLAIATLAAGARSAATTVWMLYAATLVMGIGISIYQPCMSTLTRLWAPTRAWLANAVSTNGMVMGITLVSGLTTPLVLPLVGGSWRSDLVVWCIPGLLAALLFLVIAVRGHRGPAAAEGMPRSGWPNWRSGQLWILGIALGTNNALFFAANAFVPDYLSVTGRGAMIGTVLAWMNGSQLIGSFMMLMVPERLQRQSWPFTVFGPITLLALIGLVTCDGTWLIVMAIITGIGAAITFVVTFGLPALLAKPGEVHRMAGGMFTISYGFAVTIPVICGAFWDLTGVPWTSFVPIALCSVIMTVFGTMLTRSAAQQR
ncbi:MFS transporter [Rhodoplanes sp. Z2-YC6860]|uniref:MFS transporter n=1 Tax=Rhodoplanes sp. Z2-YC6860 TaxID=674703 RepID=UPI00078DE30E|nr:MFS transporter [Rhodoplanes sp. Z2-YC6860]AMN38978.1 major facilitator superfamily protein [Rhodoplanes sp. Z2-YC6860]